MSNLTVYRNKKAVFSIPYTDAGTVIDLSDWEILFTAKAYLTDSDEDAVISKQLTIEYPETGIASLTLDAADVDIKSGEYWYSIDAYPPDDATIIIDGVLTVKQSVHHDNPVITST